MGSCVAQSETVGAGFISFDNHVKRVIKLKMMAIILLLLRNYIPIGRPAPKKSKYISHRVNNYSISISILYTTLLLLYIIIK